MKEMPHRLGKVALLLAALAVAVIPSYRKRRRRRSRRLNDFGETDGAAAAPVSGAALVATGSP